MTKKKWSHFGGKVKVWPWSLEAFWKMLHQVFTLFEKSSSVKDLRDPLL